MKKNITILFACVIMGVFALAGCNNPLAVANQQGTDSAASGAVVVSIGTPAGAQGARTIYPAALDNAGTFTRYELTFSGESVHAPEEIIVGSANVTLPVGDWTITATAYSGDTATAQGSAAVTIVNGGTAQASITLGPISTGAAGTLNYTVTAPAGATGTLTVKTATGEAVTGGTITLPATDTLSLPAGEYLLFVSLTKAGQGAGQTEILHIYSGLESVATFTFTDSDFISLVELTAGKAVSVAANEYMAYVTFTGATGLTSIDNEFAVSGGGAIHTVNVSGDIATVLVTFDPNTSTTEEKTYIVSIAPDSTVITGNTTVTITQAAAPPTTGTAPITVKLWINESDGTILKDNDAITIASTENLTAEVTGDYTGVQWYVDGLTAKGTQTDNSITIPGTAYPLGEHWLDVRVSKGGVPYSTRITFTVTELTE
jgi:hypothetical protein